MLRTVHFDQKQLLTWDLSKSDSTTSSLLKLNQLANEKTL